MVKRRNGEITTIFTVYVKGATMALFHEMKRVLTFAALIGFLTGVACFEYPAQANPARSTASLHETGRSSDRLHNPPGLSNVGRVAPGVYRGAQPEKDGFATLKRMGIRTVIDMRTTESEKTEVEAAGMKAVAVPIEMTRKGLKEKVDHVVALMADPANQPVYVHCRHGQDRTGIVVAAYRMKQQGWSLAEAEAEMQVFGFNNVWINFKQFIRQYGKSCVGKCRMHISTDNAHRGSGEKVNVDYPAKLSSSASPPGPATSAPPRPCRLRRKSGIPAWRRCMWT